MSFVENKKVATPVITPASSKLVDVNLGVTTNSSISQKSQNDNSFDQKSAKDFKKAQFSIIYYSSIYPFTT